jgi:hypothetical protein
MYEYVSLISRQELVGMYRYEIADALHRRHTVEIPESVVRIEPRDFKRGSDKEHLDTIACGTVLMSLDDRSLFHVVDRSMVNRAYRAAQNVQLFGK